MEEVNITVQWGDTEQRGIGIMETCTNKKDRHEIWTWTKDTGITLVRDLVYPDGDWREHVLNSKVKSAIQGQIGGKEKPQQRSY